jgi:tetratricopeptide (TPR) repeat protein
VRLRCLLAALAIALAPAAHADPPPSKSKLQAARSYVDAGLAAQKSGDYDTAIMLYKKAYELVPHPVLLFNMAQAHRLAGHAEQALALYRKYLKEDPHGAEARTARELVAELEAKQANAELDRGSGGTGEAADRSDDDRRASPADPPRRGADGTAGTADRADAETSGADAADTSPDAAPGAIAPRPAEQPEVKTAGEPVRAPRVRPLARLDLGLSFAGRQLSYDTRPGFLQAPPQGSYPAAGLRIDGDIYPFALNDPTSAFAGLGVAVSYDKSFVAHTPVSGQTDPVAVDQSHGRIGARFRLDLGAASSVTLGVDYARRRSTFDRSSLATVLDIPDVDYVSIDPTIDVDVPLSATVRAFAGGDVMFMSDAGPVSDAMNFGQSMVYGLEATAGVELALSHQVRVRVMLEYSLIALSFELNNQMTAGRDGNLSTKDITGASDRSFGAVATIGMAY